MHFQKKGIIVAIAALFAVAIAAVPLIAVQPATNYYTKIDNGAVTEIPPHGAMNYRYELPAYDENVAENILAFETSRILTDSAYLCLKVAPFRGVIAWAEAQFEELPAAVQEKYGSGA